MIYRKMIKRESSATIAIEADSQKEAQRIFDEWCKYDRNNEELNEHLNECDFDSEWWLSSLNTWEEYNRMEHLDNFVIMKPVKEKKEPKYDLYFGFKGQPGVRHVYLECSLDTVLDHIREHNRDYIIHTCIRPLSQECFIEAKKHGCEILSYECERRN